MTNGKYDRQLRLWGHAGQKALSEAHVVVLGATVTATEILKNMILPGLGFFTLVDDMSVDENTLENNFFVESSDYAAGKPLSEIVVKHLCELNPHSSGTACVQPCAMWVESFVSSLGGRGDSAGLYPSLIVVTPRVPAGHVRHLAQCLMNEVLASIPLLYAQTCGLSGIIQVQGRERLVVFAEPKQEMRVADLRMFNPFPELRQWFDVHDPRDETLFTSDPVGYTHLPWPAILYHALQGVRRDKGDASFMPRSQADYDALRDAVLSLPYLSAHPPGGVRDAVENCRPVLNRPMRLPDSLENVLMDIRVDGVFADQAATFPRSDVSAIGWAVLHGIKRFIAENGGVPPLCGYVPDISTTTQWYHELLAIYQRKMDDDCCVVCRYAMEAIHASCPTVAGDVFQTPTEDAVALLNSEVSSLTRSLVSNVWDLQLVTFTPRLDVSPDELLRGEPFKHYLAECTNSKEQFTVMLYAALLGARCFEEMFGRWPGSPAPSDINGRYGDEDDSLLWMRDGSELTRIVEQGVLCSICEHVNLDILRKVCTEVARCGFGEPFPTACIVAAAAAQECIKLLQSQRVPAGRPLVFDGYRGCFWVAETSEAK